MSDKYPRGHEILQKRIDFLRSIMWMYNLPQWKHVYRSLVHDDKSRYVCFSLDDPLRIAYSRNCHAYDYHKRVKTTLGRYIRKNLTFYGNDQYLEWGVRQVFEHQNVGNRFTLVKGEEIRESYRNKLGGESCMTGSNVNKLDMFVENDNVQLLTYQEPSGFTARALVWQADDESICMDRIYPNDGQHVSLFEQYAKKKDWLVREHNSLPDGTMLFDDKGREVTIQVPSSGLWPYLDSFQGTNDELCGEVTLNTYDDNSYKFDCTSGGFRGGVMCVMCEESGIEEDMVFHGESWYCTDCFNDNYSACDNCGDYEHDDDILGVEDDQLCRDCYDRKASECIKCGDSFYDDNLTSVNDGDMKYCSDCLEHAVKCECCRDYYLSDNITLVDNGNLSYCDDCLENTTQCGECNEYFSDELTCDCAEVACV